MAKYTYNCDMDHENVAMEVESDSDDQAMEMMLEKVKAHLAEHHSDMDEMTDDQMKEKIMSDWHKED